MFFGSFREGPYNYFVLTGRVYNGYSIKKSFPLEENGKEVNIYMVPIMYLPA
jgi:hypothetical protein